MVSCELEIQTRLVMLTDSYFLNCLLTSSKRHQSNIWWCCLHVVHEIGICISKNSLNIKAYTKYFLFLLPDIKRFPLTTRIIQPIAYRSQFCSLFSSWYCFVVNYIFVFLSRFLEIRSSHMKYQENMQQELIILVFFL